MKWRGARRSAHVEDRRGGGGRRIAAGGGLAAVVAAIALIAFPEFEPILRAIGLDRPAATTQGRPINDDMKHFVEVTLGYTEDVWGAAFANGEFPKGGERYAPAVLVLYSGTTSSPCGTARAEIGPFYCPADGKIYIDPSFYAVMAQQLKAPGDFAQAYVIAHEVAHHVQNLNGKLPEVSRKRMTVGKLEGNQLTVRLELQADCFSGVWARRTQAQHKVLEEGDLEEALRAAFQVGDDILQRMSGQEVDEASFTHGRSEQRARWFATGYKTGASQACDTFSPDYAAL